MTADLSFSNLIHGYWRLKDWQLSTQQIDRLIQEGVALGVTTIDHADIYGDYEVEAIFGRAMADNSGLRDQIELVSKCGIKLLSDKFPERKVKYYDYSYDYIVSSAENSLRNLQVEQLDVLLLHRPSPMYDPQAVARAFEDLQSAGKVRYFGVSNFTPGQLKTLQTFCKDRLITNQLEISVACLEHFENENLDYLIRKGIRPMAWSPLAGGKLFNPKTTRERNLVHALEQVATQHENSDISSLMYAWLLKHPAGILPIIGSGKIDRLKQAVAAQQIKMTDQQWYLIYQASLGQEVP